MNRFAAATVVGIVAAAASHPASAQDAVTAPGKLRIETLESGFVIAPDAKLTEINDRSATLAGVYGGWMSERTFLAGGGIYWIANRHSDFSVVYGGPVIALVARGDRRFSFAGRTLLGFGRATLSDTYGGWFGDVPVPLRTVARFGHRRSGPGISSADTRLTFEDDFFIAEPQADALWRVSRWLRLNAGVGYRVIGGAGVMDDRLRGLSGSIAVQFGK